MLYLPFPAVTQDEKFAAQRFRLTAKLSKETSHLRRFAASPPIVGRMAFREGQISNQRVILYERKLAELYDILHNTEGIRRCGLAVLVNVGILLTLGCQTACAQQRSVE